MDFDQLSPSKSPEAAFHILRPFFGNGTKSNRINSLKTGGLKLNFSPEYFQTKYFQRSNYS